jgi:general stress protein 26
MADSKKDIISNNIVDEIEVLDIAGYLKQEVKDFLKYLHYYKIKNILQNIDALKEYLICLDHQNTNQIHELEYRKNPDMKIGEHDILYYISVKGLKKVGDHKLHQKIWENDFNLSYIMQGIK